MPSPEFPGSGWLDAVSESEHLSQSHGVLHTVWIGVQKDKAEGFKLMMPDRVTSVQEQGSEISNKHYNCITLSKKLGHCK